MTEWTTEMRMAARRLSQSKAHVLGAFLTLTVGIGATTAIFSVASAVLIQPLPYPEADRLVSVGQMYGGEFAGAGEPKFLFWRERSRSFEGLACYSTFGGANGNLAGGDEAEYIKGLRVSEDFFRVLGVTPRLGRSFTREENAAGADRVAILSDGLWRRRFGADLTVLGRKVTLNDAPITIVGVMPPDFRIESAADLLVPMQAKPTANHDPNATVVGRLARGRSLSEAQAEMKTIADQYRSMAPRMMDEGETIGVRPYQQNFTEGPSRLLWILLGAASFLVLIACANVAHLNLARASSRQREFAVRAALGGSPLRIARQLVAESLLISLAAGIGGLWAASIATKLLLTVVPEGFLPDVAAVTFDWRVLAFCLATSVAAGFLSALAPVAQTRRVDVSAALKDGGFKGGTGRGRMRSALVVSEAALSLALLGAAFLLARTFANLLSVEPGFIAANVLTFQVAPGGPRYETSEKTVAFYRSAVERLSSIPGVTAVGLTNKLPLDWQFNMPVVLADPPDKGQSVQVRMVAGDYFRAMSIPVRAGRSLDEGDGVTSPNVAVVNEAFARKFLNGSLPFSRRLSIGRGFNDPNREIVGVVGDVRQNGLERPSPPMVFVPAAQVSDKLLRNLRAFTSTHFVLRTQGEGPGLVARIRAEMAAIDPAMAVSGVAWMEEVTSRSLATRRFSMILVVSFAAAAVMLALVGVFGVMSTAVRLQSRDLAVRAALGARPLDMTRMVLGQGFRLATMGVALGLAIFLALSSVMQSVLYDVSPRDPLAVCGAAVTIVLTILAASYIPARRASAVDPIEALRAE